MKLVTGTFSRIMAIALLMLLQAAAFAQTDGDTVIPGSSSGIGAISGYEEEAEPAGQAEEREEVVLRKVPDSVMNELRRDKDFEYANDPAYWKMLVKEKDEPSSGFLASALVNYVLIVIMICILIYAIVKIAASNSLFIRRGARQYDTIGQENIEEDDNLEALTASAEQQGNYRLAVRYSYRKALKDMHERQLIQLDAKRTNWDYVNAMGAHPLKKQFQLLTRAYEYVWYGEFNINAEQYGYLKGEFRQFKNAL